MLGQDLEVIWHVSDHVGVIYVAYLVERGAAAVSDGPTHPDTEMLIASIPVPDPIAQLERLDLRRSLDKQTAQRSMT